MPEWVRDSLQTLVGFLVGLVITGFLLLAAEHWGPIGVFVAASTLVGLAVPCFFYVANGGK